MGIGTDRLMEKERVTTIITYGTTTDFVFVDNVFTPVVA